MEEGRARVMLAITFEVERAGLRSIIESSSRHQVVAEACLGQTALKMIAPSSPDIAVIDYSLPDVLGLGLAHALKRHHPSMSILLYCDATTENLIVHALREGVRGFVLKSGAERHLIPALDALSDHRPYWNEAVEEGVFTRLMGGPPAPPDGLTYREREVMHLVATGHSTKVIAHLLGVSSKTVESFRSTLRRKLRLRSTADIVRYAIEQGVIDA